VNAWGLPYIACAVGARLVLPGPHLDGKSLHELIEREHVNVGAGVPTIWQGLLAHTDANDLGFSTLRRVIVGGAACPPSILHAFQEHHGVHVMHAWGMTELSPLGTVNAPKPGCTEGDARVQQQLKQGRAVFGVDMKVVDAAGHELPWDGQTAGELLVRGPWVVDRYLDAGDTSPQVDGWFPTGDVAHIDAQGFMQITDRAKDVIKSGGEWIGSIDLEHIAMAHPGVAMAACIAARHPKWDERPLLVVVRKPGSTLDRDDLLAFYDGKVAKWWVPDDVVFVDALPIGGTGKVQKNQLRELYADTLVARRHAAP
jgi:3-(methylthio)propionyl---CoA ligase